MDWKWYIFVTLCGVCSAWLAFLHLAPCDIQYEGYRVQRGQQILKLDHVPHDAEEFYRECVLVRRPVMISDPRGIDAALGWRTNRWTDEFLMDAVGDVRVNVETPTTSETWALFGSDVVRRWLPFRDFVAHLRNDSATLRYYLNLQDQGNSFVPDQDAHDEDEIEHVGGPRLLRPPLSHLSSDFSVPSFLLVSIVEQIHFWMGHSRSNGSRSKLHMDPNDNLYVVLNGTKHLTIFGPYDAERMYTYGKVRQIAPNGRQMLSDIFHAHFGQVDAEYPDLDRFPLFSGATPLKVTLQAGDMLYMPAGWYHETTSIGRHLAMNFWFVPPGDDPEVGLLTGWGYRFLDLVTVESLSELPSFLNSFFR